MTRYSLSVIDDATFYGNRSEPVPDVLNQVLLEPSFSLRYRDRSTFSSSLIGLAGTYSDNYTQLRVKETYADLSAGDFDFTAGPQDGALGHGLRLHRGRRARPATHRHRSHRPAERE